MKQLEEGELRLEVMRSYVDGCRARLRTAAYQVGQVRAALRAEGIHPASAPIDTDFFPLSPDGSPRSLSPNLLSNNPFENDDCEDYSSEGDGGEEEDKDGDADGRRYLALTLLKQGPPAI